jgi:hypothetical protein
LCEILHHFMLVYTAYRSNPSRLDSGPYRHSESIMYRIDQNYIDGALVVPHGTELFDLHNPATGAVIGQVRLGDETDTRAAIAAAKRAFPAFSRTGKTERIAMLHRIHDARRRARRRTAGEAVIEEYGAPSERAAWMATMPPERAARRRGQSARIL